MKTDVKTLKANSAKAVKNLVESEKNDNVVKSSKKTVSDAELLNDLSDISIDAVIKKTAKNRNIWKPEILSKFGNSEKSARRKLRNLQLDYSKAVVRELLLNNVDNAKNNAKTLHKFYADNLVDFSIYSNVSEETNPDKYKIIHKAYSKMNILLK